MATITRILGYEVLDSRGNPTTAALVELSDGCQAKAYVPSGASTGVHEAVEMRDGDEGRYHGKGVLKAVSHINGEIAEALIGQESLNQKEIDRCMIDLDGTDQKSRLGANAILAVSLAVARASAVSEGVELYEYLYQVYQEDFYPEATMRLPRPGFNVLNGGQHADSGLDVQEFMLMPQQETFAENVRAGSEVYHTLKSLLAAEQYTVAVGDEGGFAPRLPRNEAALEMLQKAISQAGYELGNDFLLAMDAAASEFYEQTEGYRVEGEIRTPQELVEMYHRWIKDYHIHLLEDPFSEDDFESWKLFMQDVVEGTQIVGDDLLVTNVDRIHMAIDQGLCNAVLIKPNQIGSLSETMQAIQLAHESGFATMMSHRSGDTSDTFIADLAVATGCQYIKSGALARSERVSKYNRLMEIEARLTH